MTTLKTERLFLRKLKISDKKRLINQIGNYNVSKNLSNVPFPYTIEDADNWYKCLLQKKMEFNYNIFIKNLLIGGVSLTNQENGSYNLGYWLGQTYWGHGYATESAKALIFFAKTKIKPLTIEAEHNKTNFASENVINKLGFKYIGDREQYIISQQRRVVCKKYFLKLN